MDISQAVAETSSPAAATVPDAADSQPQPKPPEAAGVSAVASVDGLDESGYWQKVENLRNEKPEIPLAPTPEPPVETPTPSAQSEPAPTPPPAVAATDTPAEPAKPEDEAKLRQQQEDERHKQMRFRPRSEDEEKALKLYRDNPALTLEECLARVKGDPAKPKEENPPESSQSIREKIVNLRKERTAATKNLDSERAAELQEQIDELQDTLQDTVLRERDEAAQKESAEEREFQSQVTDSRDKARKYYPDCAKADSELSKKMGEIGQRLEDIGDDTIYSSDAPFILARMAARELGIAPIDPNAPPPAKPVSSSPSTPTPPQPTPKPPVPPVSGAARTMTQPVNQRAQLVAQIDKVKSEDEYHELAKALAR